MATQFDYIVVGARPGARPLPCPPRCDAVVDRGVPPTDAPYYRAG